MFIGAFNDMRMLGVHRSIGLQVIFGSSVMMIMGASLVYPVLPVIADALRIGDGQIGYVLAACSVWPGFSLAMNVWANRRSSP